MSKVIILGSGAAPGVPSLCCGYGDCDKSNPKNIRCRTSIYYELGEAKILLDTSPDLRLQLINNNIKDLDAVLYSHTHADHLHGIDELREINRINEKCLNFYAADITLKVIVERFSYLVASCDGKCNALSQPHLIPNEVFHNTSFEIKDTKICPIKLLGHNVPTTGYVFNDGEVVHISDFRSVSHEGLEQIKVRPKLMVIPLTTPKGQKFHASLDEVIELINKVNPQKAVLNHLASECDYETISRITPNNVEVAYDNMIIDL